MCGGEEKKTYNEKLMGYNCKQDVWWWKKEWKKKKNKKRNPNKLGLPVVDWVGCRTSSSL